MDHVMQFIKATEPYNTFEASVEAPYLRRSFVCDAAHRIDRERRTGVFTARLQDAENNTFGV